MEVTQADGIGWSGTVTDTTAAVYNTELVELAAALVAWRRPEAPRQPRG